MKNTQLNKESIKALYVENKEYLLPVMAIMISIFLFLFVLLPQVASFPAKKTQVDNEEKKLNTFVEARRFAGSLNSKVLGDELVLATKALPIDKNYTEMVNALSSAASSSNVVIENYNFILTGKNQIPSQNSATSIPSVSLQANLKGESAQIFEFLKTIYQTVPISEIVSINYASGLAQVNIKFYYKPLPSADINNSDLIRKKSPEEQEMFDNISSWQDSSVSIGDIQIIPASESAVQTSSPF